MSRGQGFARIGFAGCGRFNGAVWTGQQGVAHQAGEQQGNQDSFHGSELVAVTVLKFCCAGCF